MTQPTSSEPKLKLAAVGDLPKAELPERDIAAILHKRAQKALPDIAPHPTQGYRPVVNVIGGLIAGFTDLIAITGGLIAHLGKPTGIILQDDTVLLASTTDYTDLGALFDTLLVNGTEYSPLLVSLLKVTVACAHLTDDQQVAAVRDNIAGSAGLGNPYVGGLILAPALLHAYTGLPMSFFGRSFQGFMDPDMRKLVEQIERAA